MAFDTHSSDDRKPCKFLCTPYNYCSGCRPPGIKRPAGMPGGIGSIVKSDNPYVKFASDKAVEEFNRRNKDRFLRLSKILEARHKYTSKHIYHLIIETTEVDIAEASYPRGPCTRSQTSSLKGKNAKAGLKRRRRLPQTVRIRSRVIVPMKTRNKPKTYKADIVFELFT